MRVLISVPIDASEFPCASIPDFDVLSGGSDERQRSRIVKRDEDRMVVRQLWVFEFLVVELGELLKERG